MSTIAVLVLFEAVFLGFLTLYGVSLGINNIPDTIAQITGPWPVYVAPACGWFDFICGGDIGSFAGQVLLWTFSAFFRVGAIFFLFYQLISVMNIITGIPFLNFIFIGFQILLALYLIGHIPTGGGGGRI